jgi:hypothetical protein
MPALLDEIAAYESERGYLEANMSGKWVLFHDEKLAGSYDDFQEAAVDAVKRFGRGPYLIRQVSGPPIEMSPSLLYQRIDANG